MSGFPSSFKSAISIEKGKYKLRIYHTWRGRFILEEDIENTGKGISFDIPEMKIQGSHAQYVGQDMAFIIEKLE